MKLLVTTLIVLFSMNVFSNVATEGDIINFCSKQVYDVDKRKCLSTAQNKLFSTRALNFCSKQVYDVDKRKCLELIEGKEFSKEMIKFCSSQVYDVDKRKCISNASHTLIGTPAPRGCEIRNLRSKLISAARELEYGYVENGLYLINRLIDSIPFSCN